MSQMTLSDLLPPVVAITDGSEDRPNAWTVSYPDGRLLRVRRCYGVITHLWRVDEGGTIYAVPAGSIPGPVSHVTCGW